MGKFFRGAKLMSRLEAWKADRGDNRSSYGRAADLDLDIFYLAWLIFWSRCWVADDDFLWLTVYCLPRVQFSVHFIRSFIRRSFLCYDWLKVGTHLTFSLFLDFCSFVIYLITIILFRFLFVRSFPTPLRPPLTCQQQLSTLTVSGQDEANQRLTKYRCCFGGPGRRANKVLLAPPPLR